MFSSKIVLLTLALCALGATSSAEDPIPVLGETCTTPCGVTTDIKASFADYLLLLINLPISLSHPMTIIISEVYRGNRTSDIQRSVATIIGLDANPDLKAQMNVFVNYIENQEAHKVSKGLKSLIDGTTNGLDSMLSVLKSPDTDRKYRVCKKALAYYMIAYLVGFRTSYSKDPEDSATDDTHADQKVEEAMCYEKAGEIFKIFKYFGPGSADLWKFMVSDEAEKPCPAAQVKPPS